MNTTLLKKVKAAILKHPDQFEMENLFQHDLKGLYMHAGGCGTAACIAGWTYHILLGPKMVKTSHKHAIRNAHDVWDKANAALKLQDAGQLFYTWRWPVKYQVRYREAQTPLARAKAAASRIDHFLKTKGRE